MSQYYRDQLKDACQKAGSASDPAYDVTCAYNDSRRVYSIRVTFDQSGKTTKYHGDSFEDINDKERMSEEAAKRITDFLAGKGRLEGPHQGSS